MMPIVQRSRALLHKYDVWSSFWDANHGQHTPATSMEMLLNAIADPARLRAYHAGIPDDHTYEVFKDHDFQCRAVNGSSQCERTVCGPLEEFDETDNRFLFCTYHYKRIPEGKVRLWSNNRTVVPDDEDAETEAA